MTVSGAALRAGSEAWPFHKVDGTDQGDALRYETSRAYPAHRARHEQAGSATHSGADWNAIQFHEIGWHSSRHLNAWRSLPVRAVRDVRDMPVMFRNGEHHPDLFRPPYGKATLLTLLAMRRQRQSYAPWTVVSGDTHAYHR